MYIVVSPSEGKPAVSLEEPDDCSRFHVTIHDLSEDTARQALEAEDIGHLTDAGMAWIKISAIRKLATGHVQPDWPERFSAMLDYAGRKGWLSDDRAYVRGHCEWI